MSELTSRWVGTVSVTGAILRAILCFCDAENTPKIAADRDDLALPLIDKIKRTVGERDGSQSVSITFGYGEEELAEQFHKVAVNIEDVFHSLAYCTGA